MRYLGVYDGFVDAVIQNRRRDLPSANLNQWTVPVLFATLDDGSVWELRYGAKEWRELPPIPGSKRAREKGEDNEPKA